MGEFFLRVVMVASVIAGVWLMLFSVMVIPLLIEWVAKKLEGE